MLILTFSLIAAVAALPPLHPSEKVVLDSRQYVESLVEYRAHPSLDPSGQILEGLLIHDRLVKEGVAYSETMRFSDVITSITKAQLSLSSTPSLEEPSMKTTLVAIWRA